MKKSIISVMLLMVFTVFGYSAKSFMVEIPGVGSVGFEKKSDKVYSIGIPKWGTYDFEGYFKSAKDFDLTAALPAGDFTDYVPGVGQILSLLGLDTVSLTLKPKGLGLGLTLESGGLGALRGKVTEALSKVKALRVAIDAIISQLEIKSIVVNGMIDGKILKGAVSGEISVIGKSLKFDVDGEISFKRILDGITDKIIPAVSDFVADAAKKLYKKTKELAKKAGAAAAKKAKNIYGAAVKIAKDVCSSISHASHSLNKCLNECTPNYANPQGKKMLASANDLFKDFYNEIYNDVMLIEGKDAAETKQLRKDAFYDDWAELEKEVDAGWNKMYKDDYVENFAFKDSSEKKLIKKYKQIIQGYWDQHKSYKFKLLTTLFTEIKP